MITINEIVASEEYKDSLESAIAQAGRYWINYGHRRIYLDAGKVARLAGMYLDEDSKNYYDLKGGTFHIDGNEKDIEMLKKAFERRARILLVNNSWRVQSVAEKFGLTVDELREILGVKEYLLALPYPPQYHSTPTGDLFLYQSKVLKKVRIEYVPDNYREYDRMDGAIALVDAHYNIEAIDVSDHPEAQPLLAEAEERQRAKDLMKSVRKNGTLIERENGKQVDEPEGITLHDSFRLDGTGERLIETPAEYWYLVNHGMDGDDWSVNTVFPSAYGWRLPK